MTDFDLGLVGLRFEQTKNYAGRAAWKVYRDGSDNLLGRIEWWRHGYAFSARGHMPTFTTQDLLDIAEFITSQDG